MCPLKNRSLVEIHLVLVIEAHNKSFGGDGAGVREGGGSGSIGYRMASAETRCGYGDWHFTFPVVCVFKKIFIKSDLIRYDLYTIKCICFSV